MKARAVTGAEAGSALREEGAEDRGGDRSMPGLDKRWGHRPAFTGATDSHFGGSQKGHCLHETDGEKLYLLPPEMSLSSWRSKGKGSQKKQKRWAYDVGLCEV